MSTLANSFIQGAGLVRQAHNDHHTRKRQERADERADERHVARMKNLDADTAFTEEKRDEWRSNADNREEARQRQATLEGLQIERTENGIAYDEKTAERNQTRFEQSQDDRLRQENLEWLKGQQQQALYQLEQTGELPAEYYHRMQGTQFDIGYLTDEKVDQQLDFLSAAMNPEDDRADPKDPRFLTAFNNVFKHEVNKGLEGSTHPETGAAAVSKEIIAAHPVENQPGKFYVELKVNYADGNTRTEPMTKGRDNKQDTELSTVDTGDLVQQVSARQAYKNVLKKSGLADAYKDYENKLIQKKRRVAGASAEPDYEEVTKWRGQAVKVKDVVDEYEQLDDARYVDTAEGRRELISFDDFLWTGGDPKKRQALMFVADANRKAMQHNQMLDDGEKPRPMINVRQYWQQALKDAQDAEQAQTEDERRVQEITGRRGRQPPPSPVPERVHGQNMDDADPPRQQSGDTPAEHKPRPRQVSDQGTLHGMARPF